MKKLFCLCCTTFLLSVDIYAQIIPRVDDRIELTSIICRLAGYEEYNNNQFKKYADDVDVYFQKYKNHPLIEFAKNLYRTKGVSFDAIPGLATRLNPAPLFTPRVNLGNSDLDTRWGTEDAAKYAELLQQFYKETKCKFFFETHASLYRIAEQRMKRVLKKINFKWYKDFYGEQPDGKFNLFIGLLNGGSNYNSTVPIGNNKEDLFAIIGTWKTDKQGLPLYDESFLPTVIHEFGHSFNNRLVITNMDKMLPNAEIVFRHVENDLRNQGYGSAKTMLIESLLRACVIKYLHKNPTKGIDVKLETGLNESAGFLWTENLGKLLSEYESERKKYPTLKSFMPRIVDFFNNLPPQITELKKIFNSKRPTVINVAPVKNNDLEVDENIREIKITFSKEMFDRKGFGLIDANFPVILDSFYFEKDRRTFVCKVKLKRKREYGFYLSFSQFGSADGYLLKENYLIYFTTSGYAAPSPDTSYGYKIAGEQIKFFYRTPEEFPIEIKSVSVAGDFNKWNPEAEGWQLKQVEAGLYELSTGINKVGKRGERKMFKFVINGGIWIEPVHQKAKNIVRDNDYYNLILEL
jgi:Domain of unknown function (DUF4932)